MLYRFELADYNEGFMQSLDEFGTCEETQDILFENFNKHLTVPTIERGINTKSYFTEKAIIKFENDINNLIEYWKEAKGVKITKIAVESVKNIYYKDDLQVLEQIQ